MIQVDRRPLSLSIAILLNVNVLYLGTQIWARPAIIADLTAQHFDKDKEALGKMPTRQRYSPPSKTPTTKFGDAPKKCSIAFVERGGAVSLAIRLQGLLPAVGGYLSDNVHLILLVRYNFAKRIDL